jgi:hypothetical protein
MSNKTRNLARNLLAMMALGASMGSVPGVSAAEKPKDTKKAATTQAKAAVPAPKGVDMKSAGIGALPGAGVGGAVTFGLMKWLSGAGSGPMLDKDGKPVFDNSVILGIMGKRITDDKAKPLATTGCRATLLAIAENSNLLKQGASAGTTQNAGHLWLADGKVIKQEDLSDVGHNYLPAAALPAVADANLAELKIIDFGGATLPPNKSDAPKQAQAINYAAALSLVGGDADMLRALKGTGLKVTWVKGGANDADFELKATSAAEDKEVKLTGKVGKPETYKFEVAK